MVLHMHYVHCMKWLSAFLAIGCLLGPPCTSLAESQADNARQTERPTLQPLYQELRSVFLKHYPKATSHLFKEKMHFEHDTRVFIVHEPTKNGEWQDPWETRGPKPGGILCDISAHEGRYAGAAVVPQTFDKRYFKVLFLAPYSEKHDRHLIVYLSYPANVKSELLNEFTRVVNDLSRYLDFE
jgi:hypothetical protein